MELKVKTFDLGKLKINMHNNGFPKGLILKRNLSLKECKYILNNLLGFHVYTKDDCYDYKDYEIYNNQLKEDVNNWLLGEFDDSVITEYASNLFEEKLSIMNLILILSYLKDKKVID